MLLLILLAGGAYRLMLSIRLPVGYDEVFVMAVGLLEMAKSPAAWLVETPMQRSSALAPLWWWVESLPPRVMGEVTLTGLRLVPMLCSLAIPALGYACAARRFGRRAALVFAGFLALSDILSFCTVRSDFFEALLLVCMIPVVCGAGRRQRGVLRGACWAGMALTFFGKAMFIVALNVLGECVVAAVSGRDRGARVRGLLVSLILAVVPVGAWFTLAGRHYAGRTIVHEAKADASGVLDLIRAMTLDYGKTKAHVVGPPIEAAMVWLDAGVWPTNAMALGVMLVALMLAAKESLAGPRRGWTARRRAQAALLAWAVVGCGYLLWRGATGARFHLMYLPALWLLAALTLPQWRRLSRSRKVVAAAVCIVAAVASLGWVSWSDARWSVVRALAFGAPLAVIVGVIVARLFAAPSRGLPTERPVVGTALAAFVALTLWGPAVWGPAAKFEPMFQRNPQDATGKPWTESMLVFDNYRMGRIEAIRRRPESIEILLSNYFRTKQPPDLDGALHFAQRGVVHDPGNVLTWTYLGLALDETGAAVEERRQAWEKALELKPESEFIADRLRALRGEGRGE
ncbi:MAG: hypothetical protein IT449_15285 [Phycisphaerales bacterium]|nr:hypothetical protein [Phycisphaerales bacterium]